MKAAKEKTLWLVALASALLFSAPTLASSHIVLPLKTRAELKTTSGPNRVELVGVSLESASSYYDAFGEVTSGSPVAPNSGEASFLRNVRATFGESSVFNSAVRHRGNIVIQRSDIPLSIQNLRRMQSGNSPFVRNAAGEWEALNLHHVGRQDGKLIEILSSHNTYNPVNGGPLHIPGPGGPLRQSRLSQTYWQQRLEDLINSGQISDDLLRQLGR